MSRGQGRVFRPKVRGKRTAIYWWDYSVPGCACGQCDATGRHRESSGLRHPDATTADVFELMRQRKKERASGRPAAPPEPKCLREYVTYHLAEKAHEVAEDGQPITARWIAENKHMLGRAVAFFGEHRALGSILRADMLAWVRELRKTMRGGTARHHVLALSNLFQRAIIEELVTLNPVATLGDKEKPKANKAEAKWLEIFEGALLLEAAKHYEGKRADIACPFAYPLLATFLLSGGRKAEVLGLEVGDISFDRQTITFRYNEWRRLKTAGSARVVPLPPQLREILEQYLAERPPSRLLFPSYRTGKEALYDPRKLLDAIAERVGWKAGDITLKMLRHTFCASRLQTLDHGAPVAIYTVSREMGHNSTAMVERIYSHLGQVHHRSEHLEYRVEQHLDKLKDRLARLEFAINNGKLFEGSAEAVADKSLSSNARP